MKKEEKSELASLLLERRNITKRISTYLEKLSRTERLHAGFNQSVARTGRLSSSEPINLQNIPRDKEIRRLFVASEGHVLGIADLSQAELRVLAHYSKDNVLWNSYNQVGSNQDIHGDTAEYVGLYEYLNKEDGRFAGKTGNFSVVYGVYPNTFRLSLYKATEGGIDLSFDQSSKVVAALNDRYDGIRTWKAQVLRDLRKNKWARTIEGRYRRLPKINSPVWAVKSYTEREGINAIIQGSVGDIVNRIMVDFMADWCINFQVLQIHDEIVWELPVELVPKWENDIKQLGDWIQDYYGLSVPILVDYKVSREWTK